MRLRAGSTDVVIRELALAPSGQRNALEIVPPLSRALAFEGSSGFVARSRISYYMVKHDFSRNVLNTRS